MIKNKKLALLSVAGLLGALAIGVTTASSTGIIRTNGDDATVWKHYAAVEATFTSHGSKEFWASCTAGLDGKYGTRVFTAPATGTIEEGGDFAATTYFAELTADDDRYVAKKVPNVSYDARGGEAIATQEVAYGTAVTKLPTTTRAADDYYASYTFGGWYKDGVALADTDTVTSDMALKANWKYGDAKKVYVNDWNDSDFTLGTGIVAKSVSDLSGCTLSDDEGFLFTPGSENQENTVKVPAINFSSILDTVPVIYMPMGGANNYNYLHVTTANDTRTKLPQVGSDDVKHLTKTMLWFTKDSSKNVHMHFIDTEMTNPMDYDGRVNRSGDLTLSEAQANGTEGILFDAKDRYGVKRYYWLGRPYYFSGGGNYLDISTKTGYTVTGADVKNKSEHTSGTGCFYWNEAVANADQYVSLLGTDTGAGAKVTFDAINFSTLFAANKGIKFTIGSWNGNETFFFGATAVGVNGANLSGTDTYTTEQIEKTFHNWIVTIDDIGAHVYNQNEDKTYDIALTSGQIAGTESISMTLGAVRASGRCFWLSDVTTYHF